MKLGEATGLGAQFSGASPAISLGIIVLAVLLCFFGIKIFRPTSSAIMFLMTALFLTFAMRKISMGQIVTAFTVIGLIMAAITYKWYRLSAFIIGLFIGFSITAPLVDNFWINVSVGIALGIIANIFPVMAVMVMTSVWGGLYAVLAGIELLGINASVFITLILCAAAAFAGIVVQYLLTKQLLSLPLKERRLAAFS